ncbi:MAG TPA: hypothetical protein VH479_01405, partial [Acidimicrobiales bacterium]
MAKTLRITALVCAVALCLVFSCSYTVNQVVEGLDASLSESLCEDSDDAVVRAAARGDRAGVVEGLRAGANVDRESEGWTALACAAST